MRLRPDGVTEAIDIAALEALVFRPYERGVQVEMRLEDTESNIRSRLKGKLMAYDTKRARGTFDGELLQSFLYQVWLYWTVMPDYPRRAIRCYADLCQFVCGLPGKLPELADATSTATLREAA